MDLSNKNNIPTAPQLDLTKSKSPKKRVVSTSPKRQRVIPEKFHEGHEKDMVDPSEGMKHENFEQIKDQLDEHFGGPIPPHSHTTPSVTESLKPVVSQLTSTISSQQETSETTSENKEGIWDKAKDMVNQGIGKIKSIFTDNKNN